jgi:predicted nuclease of restriction endonuclease-like (RecB) superfamily
MVIKHGWSRSVLVHQIESDLYSRQGKAITNFPEMLPAPQSGFASQLLKDPYHLDFLFIGPDVTERQLEMALLERLKNFLLEPGKGFAFVGRNKKRRLI